MKKIQIKIDGFNHQFNKVEYSRNFETHLSLDSILDFITEFKNIFSKDYDKDYGYYLCYEEIILKLDNNNVYHEIYTSLKLFDLEWLKNIEFTFKISL